MSASYSTLDQDESSDLQLSLVGVSAEELKPTIATPMMEVTAPATLSEGYEFETIVGSAGGSRVMTVTVPKGGVEKGQKFYVTTSGVVPTASRSTSSLNAASPLSSSDQISIPVGHWRDGLCECFKHGINHSSVIMSCCCTPIAAGQVITRLQLDWLGRPVSTIAESTGSYKKIFFVVLSYLALRGLLYWYLFYEEFERELEFEEGYVNTPPSSRYEYAINWRENQTVPTFDYIVAWTYDLMHYVYYFLALFMVYNLRRSVREKYAIPGDGGEDLCQAVFVPCCATAQMLRHTTDYEQYQATLCTENGLQKNDISVV